jgi:hypothetical protein
VSRRAFVAKIAALLARDVSRLVVDIVTIRQINLYADLLELIGRSDPLLFSLLPTPSFSGPRGGLAPTTSSGRLAFGILKLLTAQCSVTVL